MEVQIQPATLENLKKVQELNLMLFKKEEKEFDPTLSCDWTFGKDGEEYFRERITEDSGCVFLAVMDDKVIGYLAGSLQKVDSWRNLPNLAELEDMFVLEEYRSLGIGKKLYLAFIDWCKSKNIKRIKVVASSQNTRALDFYRKLRFKDYDVTLEMDL